MNSADDRTVAARLEKDAADISGLRTQFDVFRFLKRMTEARHMRAFMVMSLPGEFAQVLSTCTLITNWPAELLNLYDQKRLLPRSPVFRRLRVSARPLHFDAQALNGTETEDYGALLSQFGMRHGLWFSVHDPAGGLGAIAFSGEAVPETIDVIELSYLSIVIYDQLHGISQKDMPARDLLTERETDCLNWTSAGKTSAEIAEILNLSEHTVNHYLNRATRKLDAVNRTQAVAKAIRQGVIK